MLREKRETAYVGNKGCNANEHHKGWLRVAAENGSTAYFECNG